MQEGGRRALSCRGIFGCLGWIVALIVLLLAGVCEYWDFVQYKVDSRSEELRKLFYEKLPLGTKKEAAIEFLRTLSGEMAGREVVGPEPLSEGMDSYLERHVQYEYEEFPLLRASGGWWVCYSEWFDMDYVLKPPVVQVYLFFDKDGKLVRKVFIP